MENGYISIAIDEKVFQIATINITNRYNKRNLNELCKAIRTKVNKTLNYNFDQDSVFGKMVNSGSISKEGIIEHIKVLNTKKGMRSVEIGDSLANYVKEVIEIMEQVVVKTKSLYFVNNSFVKLRSNCLYLLNLLFSDEFVITPMLVSNKTISLDHDRLFNDEQSILTLGKIYRETGLFIDTTTLLPIKRLQSIFVFNDIIPEDDEELVTKKEFNANLVEGFMNWLKDLAYQEEQRLRHMPLDDKILALGIDRDKLINIKLNLKDGEETIQEDIHLLFSELDQILFNKVLKPYTKITSKQEPQDLEKIFRELLEIEKEYKKKEEVKEIEKEVEEGEAPIQKDLESFMENTTEVVENTEPEKTFEEVMLEKINLYKEYEKEQRLYNTLEINAMPNIDKAIRSKSIKELIEIKLSDKNITMEEYDKLELFLEYLNGKLDFKNSNVDFYEIEDIEEYVEEQEKQQAYMYMSKEDLETFIESEIKERIAAISLNLPKD